MTATGVYKVKLGDRFEAKSGDVLTVKEFDHNYSPTGKWIAKCSIEGSSVIASVQVEHLLGDGYERIDL